MRRSFIWRLPSGETRVEEVDIPSPMGVSKLATKRWKASRGLEHWSEEEEKQYWDEWSARNPVSAYRLSEGELEWREDGYYERDGGRPKDGAVLVGELIL